MKALELVKKTNNIQKFYFLVHKDYVQNGQEFTCNYGGIENNVVFQIKDNALGINNYYDLGKCYEGIKANADIIASFVDKCGLKVEDITFNYGEVENNHMVKKLNALYISVKP